jgi:hypothetical protein
MRRARKLRADVWFDKVIEIAKMEIPKEAFLDFFMGGR